MCTVTLVPRKTGYRLAMNRDERLTRVKAFPPRQFDDLDGSMSIHPSEPDGGTWISLNSHGVALALINWYSVPTLPKSNRLSRGKVVPSARNKRTPDDVANVLDKLPLTRMNPFRLIGIFSENQQAFEWRWNQAKLSARSHSWESQQWISSGFDEPEAQRVRDATFRQKLQTASPDTLEWLRDLHASHEPLKGPFSTCMHRNDAATVSYTEIEVADNLGAMAYLDSAACCGRTPYRLVINTVSSPRILFTSSRAG